jgi:hypothetical protein
MKTRHLGPCAFVIFTFVGGAAVAQETDRAAASPPVETTQRGVAAGAAALVADLRISDLDDPAQRTVAQLQAGARGVRCSFALRSVPRGTAISVRWLRDGEEVMTSDFADTIGNSTLSSHLEAEGGLQVGDYVAEVLVDGVPEARAAFEIRAAENVARTRAASRPSWTGVVITESTCEAASGSSATADRPRFGSDVGEIFLCLQYADVGAGRRLDVRWYRGAARAPMAVTRLEPEGSGELSASYLPQGPMEPGAYHVVVALDRQTIHRVDFTVEPVL